MSGTRPLTGLDSVALLSNGASRIVSPYGLTGWPGVLKLLRSGGPAEIIRRVRQAEARSSGGPNVRVPDDATVAHCTRLRGIGCGPGVMVRDALELGELRQDE